ncbi:MAG: bifunctional proline dehydrogenase/L-glutamate gamma-semialdehyde dehydrogenase PutA [Pseudomonadota bacterium]|nr:bifunctional proline dehydrogenase/L-glutamate gamma-semialdehyde dehydrogenase PutA [Pseudomonadota bacterium]
MVFDYATQDRDPLREAVMAAREADESGLVTGMLQAATFPEDAGQRIRDRATKLIRSIHRRSRFAGPEAFLNEFSLTGAEGSALMTLAESALRTPDDGTLDRLIRDKIEAGDWATHAGHSASPIVNLATRVFMLSALLLQPRSGEQGRVRERYRRFLETSGQWMVRQGVKHALNQAGRRFILGASIEDGLTRGRRYLRRGYTLSFDMLGESALTREEADGHYERYAAAIEAIEKHDAGGPAERYGISVKLSAISPRFVYSRYQEVLGTLVPRLRTLAIMARDAGVGLTIDAEETQRLELQLDVLAALMADPLLSDYDGLGVAVQTYQKRAWPLIDWLASLARDNRRRLMVRLTKGAYWDAEIRAAQLAGLDNYPVFTRKASTDVSFIACARKLLSHADRLYPMFATHNAHTVASVMELAGDIDYEFQRLHGMGGTLFDRIVSKSGNGPRCRVYAPCGDYASLLPYLVRRLLENGANTSFVHRIADPGAPVDELTADPAATVRSLEHIPHPRIPVPGDLFAPGRSNSRGIDLSDERSLTALAADLQPWAGHLWGAAPLLDGKPRPGPSYEAVSPADRRRAVGIVTLATGEDLDLAVTRACAAATAWGSAPASARAACLERAADLYERNRTELIALCVREAGKTLESAVAEIREAVDFCRYYACRAREGFSGPRSLPGPHGAGVVDRAIGTFACISPWNFPLAIFTGQVAAALAAGNSVVAKPAEQTPLIAMRAVMLLHDAGVPVEALQLVTGAGETGARLVSDPRIDGVAFTGSTGAAQHIRRALVAGRRRNNAPLIAETGGQNAMIADSTARLEQVVNDVLRSAFDSAGQRCSALRVLFIQEDVADTFEALLTGAMAELKVGDPAWLGTDVGPVIDAEARQRLEAHADSLESTARLLHRCETGPETRYGTFFAPLAYEIDSLKQLTEEHFGPILHVVRFGADELDRVVREINGTGYGLTFGLQTRIDGIARELYQRVRAGNHYVNRNMIGAVVGSQPFGGEGLSGTGPKAGGPHYLRRFSRAVPDGPVQRVETLRPPVVTSAASSGAARDPGGQSNGRRLIGLAARASRACDALDAAIRRRYLEQCAATLLDSAGEISRTLSAEIDTPADLEYERVSQAHALCLAWGTRAEAECAEDTPLPGATGERNHYRLHNRGAVLCIIEPRVAAPLAPTLLAAVLATGNAAVLAPLPGAQASMERIFDCFRSAPWPGNALAMVHVTSGETLDVMLRHPKLAGVAYAGGTETAHRLERALAERPGALIPLIADTRYSGEIGPFSDPANLYRFCTARTLSVDTTATGGNASLYAED